MNQVYAVQYSFIVQRFDYHGFSGAFKQFRSSRRKKTGTTLSPPIISTDVITIFIWTSFFYCERAKDESFRAPLSWIFYSVSKVGSLLYRNNWSIEDSFAFKLNQKLSFHESIATFSQSKILVFCRNPLEAVQFCPLCRSVKSLCHVSSVLYFHPKTIFPRFEPCDETVVRPLPAFSLIIRHSIVFPQPRLFFDQTPSLSLQIRWNIDFLSSDWKCSIVVVTPRIIATKSV